MNELDQTNAIVPVNSSSKFDVFTFGDPVPVLDHRDILDSLRC